MSLLLALALTHTPANAGRFRDWCERHLVMEHPWPYGEHSTRALFELYHGRIDRERVLKELVYRLRHGLLSESEQRFFWDVVEPKRRDAGE